MPRAMRLITDEDMQGNITTFTGRIFNVIEPDPAKVNIVDIGHHLSQLCRFTGATREFYSVAQHSVLASNLVKPQWALQALLHDASEAYLNDIARPVKYAAGFGPAYKELEEIVMVVVAEALGFSWPEHKSVKAADEILLRTEQRDLMPAVRRHAGDTLEETIWGWEPKEAEFLFFQRYEEITGEKPRR